MTRAAIGALSPKVVELREELWLVLLNDLLKRWGDSQLHEVNENMPRCLPHVSCMSSNQVVANATMF